MLGTVFTEFVDMVADKFSDDMVDDIIEASDLPSGGAYTAVGSYNYTEMLALVTALSARVEVPVPELVRIFGHHLFGRFEQKYPGFFEGVPDCFAFLSTIENHIHVEVRKLYPAAELPTFKCTRNSSDLMEMIYRSKRPFADLAEGLIRGAADHFGETIMVERTSLPCDAGTAEKFTLRRESRSNV